MGLWQPHSAGIQTHKYITTNQNTYICLYDDQIPSYLFVVESFSKNDGAKQRQWDIKSSVGCLKHTEVHYKHKHD